MCVYQLHNFFSTMVCKLQVYEYSSLKSGTYTEPEVFLDKRVREMRQTERGNTRGAATKKHEISRTLLP